LSIIFFFSPYGVCTDKFGRIKKEAMIAYDLQCSRGHVFEGWFDDLKSFENQRKNGLVSCPICSDASVCRIPSTFSIRSTGELPMKQADGKTPDGGSLRDQIVDFVRKNFDDVGTDFAKEALKMHYGVEEPRSIRGTSTQQEEETLRKEGIQFFKIPIPALPETDA
jgi:hypothetical protein